MSIAPVTMQAAALAASRAEATQAPVTTDFKALLSDGIARLDGTIQDANQKLDLLATGGDIPVHDVMIAMEKARMSLEFAVQVRNRLVDAYQEFMRMQV